MKGDLTDIGLKYARAFVYILGILILLFSPYRAQLLPPSSLSFTVIVILFYVIISVWLEVKEVPRNNKWINRMCYICDTLVICWVISLTGGASSPVYTLLFLPVIFVAFDHGLKEGLIFSGFTSIMGTLAFLSTIPPGLHHFLSTIFTLFILALTVGFLKDNWEKDIEKEKLYGSLRALILEDLTWEEVLAQAFEIIAKAVKADVVIYLLYDPESESLKFQSVSYGLFSKEEEEKLLARRIPLEEGGLSVEVFQTGNPVLVRDAKAHPYILQDIRENFKISSVMSFPVTIRGKRQGVLHLVRREGSAPFNEKDFQKAENLVAVALSVLRMIEEAKEIERRRNLLEMVAKLLSNLSRAINIEEVGRELFYTFQEIFDNLSEIVLVRYGGEEYSIVFHQTEEGMRSSLLRSALDKIREKGQIVSMQGEGEEEGKGVIGVPIWEEGKITHGLFLLLNPFRSFSEEGNALLSMVAVEMSNILARVYSAMELERYAFHDPLTGLLNRRMFYQRMGREIRGARRYGYPISLAILDIDNFKRFNDTYGHLEGDKVLAELGRLLKEEIRASDFAARIGGEEFAIVLPHTPKDSAVFMADRLLKKVKEKLGLSVSIGVGEFPSDSNTLRGLMRKADNALYEAKRLGKGRVQISRK